MQVMNRLMINVILIVFFFVFSLTAVAQEYNMDSLSNAIVQANNDADRIHMFEDLINSTVWNNPVWSVEYSRNIFLTVKEHHLSKSFEGVVSNSYGYALGMMGNYPEAIKYLLISMEHINEIDGKLLVNDVYASIVEIYRDDGDFKSAGLWLNKWWDYLYTKNLDNGNRQMTKDDQENLRGYLIKKAQLEEKSNHLDSALHSVKMVIDLVEKYQLEPYAVTLLILADIYRKKGEYSTSIVFYKKSESLDIKYNIIKDQMDVYSGIAKIFMDLGESDSCIYYAKKTIQLSKSNSYPLARMDAYNILSKLYKSQKMMDSAVKYLELTSATKDSLFNQTKERAVQSLSFDQKLEEQEKQQTAEQRKQELKAEDERYLNRIRFYGIVAALIVFSVVGFILYRNIRQKQFADLRHKTTELEMQVLRAQMNPHFIFNSLNSINRFILQNNRLQASEYLTKFSRLVRLILQNSQAAMITLESELESVKLYLILEALRFDYHFEYKISVYPDLDISALKVPPLIIQPYVENAVWHGLMHKEEKGKLDIELSQENDYLYFKITDNGIGRKQAAAFTSKSATRHKSMGLSITAHRIAMLHPGSDLGSSVVVNDLVNSDGTAAGTEVIIKIPAVFE